MGHGRAFSPLKREQTISAKAMMIIVLTIQKAQSLTDAPKEKQ
jgi:hypothetical protein